MKEDNASYGIILLAAGTSRRLGRPKQLLNYKGDSLLNRAVKTALRVKAGATVVVLGAGAETLTDEVRSATNEIKDSAAAIALNPQFREGMASSIRCGVRYMMEHFQIDHLIIMLCDQPYVDAVHLTALIHKHKAAGTKIVASLYEGRKGAPALFDTTVFPELLALAGDGGAKHIIEKYGVAAAAVPFSPGAVDIDTDEAYRALQNTPPANTPPGQQ